MTFKEQIKAIIDSVQPQFDTLGLYMFQGAGEPENVSKSFVSIFEAYQKAKELTRQTFGTDCIELQEGSMWCSPIGGVVDTDDSEMQAAYEIAMFIDDKDVVYTIDRKRLLYARKGFTDNEYFVPEGTLTICDQAFLFHEGYLVLSVPASIKVIGDDIFGKDGGKIIIRDEL